MGHSRCVTREAIHRRSVSIAQDDSPVSLSIPCVPHGTANDIFFFISLPSDHICFQIAKQYNVIQPLRKTESRAQLHVSGRDNQIHLAR